MLLVLAQLDFCSAGRTRINNFEGGGLAQPFSSTTETLPTDTTAPLPDTTDGLNDTESTMPGGNKTSGGMHRSGNSSNLADLDSIEVHPDNHSEARRQLGQDLPRGNETVPADGVELGELDFNHTLGDGAGARPRADVINLVPSDDDDDFPDDIVPEVIVIPPRPTGPPVRNTAAPPAPIGGDGLPPAGEAVPVPGFQDAGNDTGRHRTASGTDNRPLTEGYVLSTLTR